MNRLSGASIFALTMAAFLASLSVVAWRQGRALDALRELDEVRQERAMVEAERLELLQRIQHLESLAWVEAEAAERLGMRPPAVEEMIFFEGGSR